MRKPVLCKNKGTDQLHGNRVAYQYPMFSLHRGNNLNPSTFYEPLCEKTGLQGFLTRSDTNQAVQPQKMATGLKFRIKVEEGLYYPCSENKGADQLRGYGEADLRL